VRRALRGVKLIISDAHDGIKAAVSRVWYHTGRVMSFPSSGMIVFNR
jgi:hypothetical protein